jgi:uncharacterized repeat protein (TIGR01451 family)
MIRLLIIAAVLAFAAVPARAQIAGAIDWSTLGLADEAVITPGTQTTSAAVTATVTWSTVTDGGSFVAFAGDDFVSYEATAQGGVAEYVQIGFDNERQDADDKVTLNIAFSEPVSNVAFTFVDVDQAANGWDDFLEVFYDTGSGFVNAKTGAFVTLGPAVLADDETFGDGWEGNANVPSTSTDGNAVFNFGALQITAIRIVYFSGNDAGGATLNPGGQQLGVSDITFVKIMPLLSLLKTVAMAGTNGNDRFAIPGNDVLYTLTVTNSGDGRTDAGTLFVVDPIPAEVEFFNGDLDGAGPATGAVLFTQTAAGLTFSLATDVAYSNAVAAPASFAACTYTPIAGYDPNVRHLCLNPKGQMLAGNPDPTFSAQFRARIK